MNKKTRLYTILSNIGLVSIYSHIKIRGNVFINGLFSFFSTIDIDTNEDND